MFEHVLCVYPYREEIGTFGFFPPLGLEYIAATLERHARSLEVVDLRQERGRTSDFIRPDTSLVCFSVNWNRELEFVRQEIQSVPPGIFTVIGGRHASEDPEGWLRDCPRVDMVVRGDGEDAIGEFADGRPLDDVAGIGFRRNGGLVHTATRRYRPPSDDVFPRRARRRYTYTIPGTGIAIDSIAASRGCPYHCRFCSFNRNPWGEKRPWTARSVESVVRELAETKADLVHFVDDNFGYDADRVGELADRLCELGIRKKYFASTRLDIARRPDVLKKLAAAGIVGLEVGIESAQDRTLRSMQKGLDVARIRTYCRVLAPDFWLHGYFIIGNIGETREEILGILPFARELGLDTLGLSVLRFEPQCGLEELLAANPDYHVSPGGKIYSNHLSAAELDRLRRQILSSFYGPRHVLRAVSKAHRTGLLRYVPRLMRLAFPARRRR